MKNASKNKLSEAWYNKATWLKLLLPFSWLYGLVTNMRKRALLRRQPSFPLPIVVVGNISVGGTGKTPVVIELVQLLKQQGWRPAVISRGYGGITEHFPYPVDAKSDPLLVGDEPVLIATRSGCPVVVDPVRLNAALYVVQNYDCDIIISDDGLQHYAMPRVFEIAVVDAARGFGNGYLLPAGPLREAVSRLASVDTVLLNGVSTAPALSKFMSFELRASHFWHIKTGQTKAVTAMTAEAGDVAVAAIGNPARFLASLNELGLAPELVALPDHYPIQASDIPAAAKRVFMTEKDAVKCRHFDDDRLWVLSVSAQLPESFAEQLIGALTALKPN